MVFVYLGSLTILLLNAFWDKDAFTGLVIPFDWTLDAFETIFTVEVYRTIAIRTIAVAVLVTLTDILLAFPIAYYMARVASPAEARLLVVAVLMPLWASYLVKIYAWRTILQGNGLLDWLLAPVGLDGPGHARSRNLARPQLPLAALHDPAHLRGPGAIPNSLLEASSDLGARSWQTFRRVVLPLALPALVAGSIFTFSLTLGDYIIPDLVIDTKFIGNVIYDNSTLGNLPIAAAYSLIPIVIMLVYLLIARRLGAFESL